MKEDSDPPRYEVLGISLRLRHPQSRELGQMMRHWGLEPRRSWRVGDPCVSIKGKPLPGLRRDSFACSAPLTLPATGTLETALLEIMEELTLCKSDLRAFADEGGTAELFVAWTFFGASGGVLDWSLMQMLSEHRLDLSLSICPDEGRFDELDSPDTDEA